MEGTVYHEKQKVWLSQLLTLATQISPEQARFFMIYHQYYLLSIICYQ